MYFEDFISYFLAAQIISCIISIILGAYTCFGALKWRKGLISSIAAYWGLFLGVILGAMISTQDLTYIILFAVLGGVIFPILTYHIAGVNRFVIGFIVAMKLTFMVMTVLLKENQIGFDLLFTAPLIVGTIVGFILMAWTQIRVSAFVLACAFIGASELAPALAQLVNSVQFGITGDIGYFIDVYDIFFAFFRIELTDGMTLLFMIILMGAGIATQLRSVKNQGYDYSTPLIVFETTRKELHGRILS